MEISENEMHQFIALRKTPRVQTVGLATMSIEDKRSRLVTAAHRSERADDLVGLGLQQIQLEERSSEAPMGFLRLGYIGAYVVNAPDEQTADRARQALEPDYHIMPNIQLFLPMPMRVERRLRRGRKRPFWPAESGVDDAHSNGVTGSGVLVVVLDTGCDADHLELRQKRIEFRYVPLHPNVNVMRAVRGFDVDGHGTHVCGIIAGRNVGIAPDVDLMVASVIESETYRTSLERIVIALDWLLSQFQFEENRSKPTIINMSFGFKPEWISTPDLQTVMDGIKILLSTLVTDFDVLPVGAIGNDGPGTTRAPASFPETLSVGAVDFDLKPAYFSGSGHSPITQRPEPDIAGYGVEVLSSLERDRDKRSWYALMSGTSMAAPYVTGVAALSASANPELFGNALRQHITSRAMPLDAPSDRVGAGLARFTP